MLALILLASLRTDALAVDGHRLMSQYLSQRWSAEQGLQGMANAIAQTLDGYLWIGTDKGLFRFDGQSLQRVEVNDSEGAPLTHVLSLTVDAKGSMWVWMQGARVLRYESGKFRPAFEYLADDVGVTAMGRRNGDGILLSVAGQHIVGSAGNKVQQLGVSPGPLVVALAETEDGKVWLGTRDSGLFNIRNGKSYPVEGKLPDRKINCLLASNHGRLWIGTDSGLVLWNGVELARDPLPGPLNRVQILSMLEDRNGNLWVGTAMGLVRYNSEGAFLLDGPPEQSEPITALMEDREGNIWFGDSHGIERLRDSAFSAFTRAEGLPEGAIGPIYVDLEGRTWFAPKRGGLYWMRDGQVHPVAAAGLGSDVIYSIDGKDNDVLVGRQRGGLTRLHIVKGVTITKTYQLRNKTYPYVVFTVHENRDGSIWAGTLTGGAFHIANDRIESFGISNGLASEAINAIEEGSDGAMWFGTSSGLTVHANGRWHTYFERDGLPSAVVTCLLQDKSGRLWIGTTLGLAYLSENKVYPILRDKGILHGTAIAGVAEDRDGALWILTASKVVRVAADALLSGSRDSPALRVFGIADGLRGLGGIRRSRSVVTDQTGRVWIATDLSISVVDPAAVAGHPAPAIARVESVLVNGDSRRIQGNAPLEIQANQRRIEFLFTGLSFASPEMVRYRYRLDGYDQTWSEASAERRAVYTNLSPKLYRFHVMASNSDGTWSEIEDSVPVKVLPLFWQTWPFRILVVFATALLTMLLYQLRIRQINRRANQMFEERLAERTRIAQDLHDTLLQGFFSASMQLQTVAKKLPGDLPAKPQLDRILALMGKVLDEGRGAVRGLRSQSTVPIWLEDVVEAMLQDIGAEEEVKHGVRVEGTPRHLRPAIQEEVCRIAQEAIGNAYRHASASRLEISIRYSSRMLNVGVRDDGIGIAPEVLACGREGHWGLVGMRERAENIGARLQITSTLDRGTTVAIAVPGHIAFEKRAGIVRLARVMQLLRSRLAGKRPGVAKE